MRLSEAFQCRCSQGSQLTEMLTFLLRLLRVTQYSHHMTWAKSIFPCAASFRQDVSSRLCRCASFSFICSSPGEIQIRLFIKLVVGSAYGLVRMQTRFNSQAGIGCSAPFIPVIQNELNVPADSKHSPVFWSAEKPPNAQWLERTYVPMRQHKAHYTATLLCMYIRMYVLVQFYRALPPTSPTKQKGRESCLNLLFLLPRRNLEGNFFASP